MGPARLPKNRGFQNKQENIRKLKQQSNEGEEGTFLHFRRLYLLNSPPGVAVDRFTGADGQIKKRKKLTRNSSLNYFHVFAACEIDEREGIMSSRYSL